MARGEPPRPGTQLPAPYRNPWGVLADALRAVVADRRLALQRLWRRNREGDLPRPALWPRDLAPVFWPLLLSLALVLVISLAGWLLGALRASPTTVGSDGTVEPVDIQPTGDLQPMNRAGGAAPQPPGQDNRTLEPRPPSLAQKPEASGPGPGQAGPAPGGAAGTGTAGETEGIPAAPAPVLRLDPLLELLSQGEGAGLLLAARPDPASSRLSLTLSARAEALPEAELLTWAQRWQQRAREAGYERLELLDRQGQLRGRGALVGSGMILLAPVPAA